MVLVFQESINQEACYCFTVNRQQLGSWVHTHFIQQFPNNNEHKYVYIVPVEYT